jgi:hypothetical protein
MSHEHAEKAIIQADEQKGLVTDVILPAAQSAVNAGVGAGVGAYIGAKVGKDKDKDK